MGSGGSVPARIFSRRDLQLTFDMSLNRWKELLMNAVLFNRLPLVLSPVGGTWAGFPGGAAANGRGGGRKVTSSPPLD